MKKCANCNKMAVWMYEPSGERKEKDRYLCDTCITRGCSCNIDPNSGLQDVDQSGRNFPCCEYLFNDEGFDE